ncbi:MAG: hypothetical protein CM1200mP40_27240 [Gammaproteobacteria bacterium]|nr:MAG: hypothetical protein CM1200mP40_27240 [Gammaproteobacteria bacterium]
MLVELEELGTGTVIPEPVVTLIAYSILTRLMKNYSKNGSGPKDMPPNPKFYGI